MLSNWLASFRPLNEIIVGLFSVAQTILPYIRIGSIFYSNNALANLTDTLPFVDSNSFSKIIAFLAFMTLCFFTNVNSELTFISTVKTYRNFHHQ